MTTLHFGHLRRTAHPGTPADLTRAWAAVALVPVFFIVAFATGEVTISMLGYSSGGDVPLWVSLIADLSATAVGIVPCIAAVVFGQRARLAHLRGAVAPLAIGAAFGLGIVLLTVITEIGNYT